MKNIILVIAISVSAAASEYYAKAEPYKFYTLQANVAGLVVKADENLEGKVLSTEDFIVIDDEIDRKEHGLLEQKKKSLKASLELNEKMARNLEMIIEKKNLNYDRIKDLPIKSSVEKDKEYFDLVTTQNQQLSTLEKIETISSQLLDTQLRLEQLARSIKDKHIGAESMILYKLYAKKGQVVAPGMTLAEVADISKAKLTLFLNSEALTGVKEKKIYLNGKVTAYAIEKIWPLSDEEHISSYKTEIFIAAPKQFSSLYKIEFK
jgi:hypothetical protein